MSIFPFKIRGEMAVEAKLAKALEAEGIGTALLPFQSVRSAIGGSRVYYWLFIVTRVYEEGRLVIYGRFMHAGSVYGVRATLKKNGVGDFVSIFDYEVNETVIGLVPENMAEIIELLTSRPPRPQRPRPSRPH